MEDRSGATALELQDDSGKVILVCAQWKPSASNRQMNVRSLTHVTRSDSGKFSFAASLADVKDSERRPCSPIAFAGFSLVATWHPKPSGQPELPGTVRPAEIMPAPAEAPKGRK